MATRRNKCRPIQKFQFWKKDGELFYCAASDLQAILDTNGLTDEEIRKRMGHGYFHLAEALSGKRLDCWAVSHIEYGILPDSAFPKGANVPWTPK